MRPLPENQSPDSDENYAGFIDYEARCAVRNLIRLHGFEAARERIAFYLNDEADRKPRSQQ